LPKADINLDPYLGELTMYSISKIKTLLFILTVAMGSINISLAQKTGIFDVATVDIIATSSSPYLLDKPRDLDFHPTSTDTMELWVLNRGGTTSGSSVTIISNSGKPTQSGQLKKDGNAYHFMHMSTGLAFGENGDFATSPGVKDANHGGGGNPGFTGPALWSGDLSVFAEPCPGCNGSHLDMLHSSPYAKGIAHEPGTLGIGNAGNVYWVFDGSPNADIARYDFGLDHGPGQTSHAGASVQRYKGLGIVGQSLGTANSEVAMPPCHMVIDPTGWLYACDNTGSNSRVIRLDTKTTSYKNILSPPYGEGQSEYAEYNFTWEVFPTVGLNQPSGIEVAGNWLFVSDYATGEIIAYHISTKTEIGRLQTTAGIMGLKWGPEGNLWYVNATQNELVRVSGIHPPTGINDKFIDDLKVNIYPNPSDGSFTLTMNIARSQDINISVFDIRGKRIYSNYEKQLSGTYNKQIDLNDYAKGLYHLRIVTNEGVANKKVIVQ